MGEETNIVGKILRKLNAEHGCKAIKLHGNIYQERGTPDILAVYLGRCYLLEVKVPGKHATKIQNHRHKEWREAGATCDVVKSVKEALDVVFANELDRRIPLPRRGL